MTGKPFFGKIDCQMTADTLRVKNISEIALSHTISEKFKQKFKMAAKNGEEMIFGKSGQFTVQIPLGVKNFAEIALSRTV